jgi:hypothetical protein
MVDAGIAGEAADAAGRAHGALSCANVRASIPICPLLHPSSEVYPEICFLVSDSPVPANRRSDTRTTLVQSISQIARMVLLVLFFILFNFAGISLH